MNYNKLVSLAREFARNLIRLTMTNKVRAEILRVDIAEKEVDTNLTALNKRIAVATFKLSKLDAEDPEILEKTEVLNSSIKELNEAIVELNEEKENYAKRLTDLNAEIEDIASGKKKVSTETLQEVSNEYLSELNKTEMLKSANAEVKEKDVN